MQIALDRAAAEGGRNADDAALSAFVRPEMNRRRGDAIRCSLSAWWTVISVDATRLQHGREQSRNKLTGKAEFARTPVSMMGRIGKTVTSTIRVVEAPESGGNQSFSMLARHPNLSQPRGKKSIIPLILDDFSRQPNHSQKP
jgi:hypothetical protein